LEEASDAALAEYYRRAMKEAAHAVMGLAVIDARMIKEPWSRRG
jgi:hypothetical protein